MPFGSRIKLLMNKTTRQEEYKVFQENNQLVLILNSEILLPENDPVRVTRAQLEELDYRKLYEWNCIPTGISICSIARMPVMSF